MKLNPRVREVSRATTSLRLYLHELSEKYDLTTNELMQILTESTYRIFNNLVMEERKSEE